MRKSANYTLVCLTALCLAWSWGQVSGAAVSPADRIAILNHVIPLPKEAVIKESVQIATTDVKLVVAKGSSEMVLSAAGQLKAVFAEQGGGDMSKGSFEILLGVIDGQDRVEGIDLKAAATRLKGVANSDQAYVIQPDGKNRLIVAGLSEYGVYYGVTTLKQLLSGGFNKPNVTIPMATITDWPDIEQRGIWDDGFNKAQFEQFSQYKFNTLNVEVDVKVDDQGRSVIGTFPANRSLWNNERDGGDFSTYCYNHGIKCVPFVMHLGHLPRSGIYEKYPEAMGKGEGVKVAQSNIAGWRAPCGHSPVFRKVLAGWITELAKLPHVTDVSVWLTEEFVYCSCPECLAMGQWPSEAEAIVAAYREVQKTLPNLKMQILLTQGSYPVNDKVLAVIPKDIGVLYYDGGRTYDSSRQPMIYPLLEQYAASGGWLGVYPQLTVSWAVVIPWQCPQFIKARMTEFAEKKLHAMVGYTVPTSLQHDYNVAGSGEWCWNAYGRNETEFTTAWATRKGIANPQAMAEWLDTLGPVSWDLYGSSFPYQMLWLDPVTAIKMRVAPAWGRIGIFRYFDSAKKLDGNIAQCEKALEMAKKIGDPSFVEENEIVLHYYGMLKAMSVIMDCLSSNPQLSDANKQLLRDTSAKIVSDAENIDKLLVSWGKGMGLDTNRDRTGGTREHTLKIANKVAGAVRDILGDPVVRKPGVGPDQKDAPHP